MTKVSLFVFLMLGLTAGSLWASWTGYGLPEAGKEAIALRAGSRTSQGRRHRRYRHYYGGK